MRNTKSKTGNRRSHHGLKTPRLSTCSSCGESHIRHRMCRTCGTYKGREVIDMEAKIAKKQERMKRKQKELQAMGIEKEEKDKDESPFKKKKVAKKGPEEGEKKQMKKKRSALDLIGLSKRPEQ